MGLIAWEPWMGGASAVQMNYFEREKIGISMTDPFRQLMP